MLFSARSCVVCHMAAKSCRNHVMHFTAKRHAIQASYSLFSVRRMYVNMSFVAPCVVQCEVALMYLTCKQTDRYADIHMCSDYCGLILERFRPCLKFSMQTKLFYLFTSSLCHQCCVNNCSLISMKYALQISQLSKSPSSNWFSLVSINQFPSISVTDMLYRK